MVKKQLVGRLLLAFVIAFFMVMPATCFVSAGFRETLPSEPVGLGIAVINDAVTPVCCHEEPMVERALSPSGNSVMATTFFTQSFENGGSLPTGWTLTTTGRAWEMTTDSSRYGTICASGDYAAVCDSDKAGSGVSVDSWIKSPVINCANWIDVNLVFNQYYNWYGETSSEGIYIYVANDGSVSTSDTQVYHQYTADIPLETRTINISAVANLKSTVQIGFRYVANYDWYWLIDNVNLTGNVGDLAAPAQVTTLTGTAGDSQVALDWSGYNEAGQGDVAGYRVYYNTAPISDVTSLTPVTTLPAGVFQYTVTGLRNGIEHYFAVTAIDEVPNENKNVVDIGPLTPLPVNIVNIPLTTGWNLISIPVVLGNTEINAVLSSIAGQWDYAMNYDTGSPLWKSYATFKPASLNTFNNIDYTSAFWLHVKAPCTLTIQGDVSQTTSIPLEVGWNFLGYPSFSSDTTIQEALSGVSYDIVEGFSATDPYKTQVLPNNYVMKKGEGYWVHCTAASTWSITNDVLAPIVSSTSPASGATGVNVNSAIAITFSEEMDKALAQAAFSINPAVAGSFSWNPAGTVMTFTPSAALTGGPTTYTVTIGQTACDLYANEMPWVKSFAFTTVDLTRPVVSSTDPVDNEVNTPPGQDIIVTFNEAMNQAMTQSAFSIVPAAAGTFSWNPAGTVMTYNPTSTLALLTSYTVTIGTGARDLAGNTLLSSYVFDFTTSSDPVEKVAIIVGISDYQAISDLSYCDEDATDIYWYLVNMSYTCYIYGDGPAGTSFFPIYTDDATEAIVRAAIQNVVATLTSNDYFVYTTSGHGDGDGSGSSNLCQWDEGVGGGGQDGTYWDTELDADIDTCVAERQFVFIDHCYSGGMGPELMANANSANVYVATTCTENGYGYDDSAHYNGMFTYWFWQAGFDVNYGRNPATPMESCFDYASTNYPSQPPSGDAPMEFDGDTGTSFIL